MDSKYRLKIGRKAEDVASQYLKRNGYKILQRNYRTSIGEIDIIAKEKNILCFVEVKYRKDIDFGFPTEAVTKQKRKKITQLALCYIKEKRISLIPVRFDVVSILKEKELKCEIIKGAFFADPKYVF